MFHLLRWLEALMRDPTQSEHYLKATHPSKEAFFFVIDLKKVPNPPHEVVNEICVTTCQAVITPAYVYELIRNGQCFLFASISIKDNNIKRTGPICAAPFLTKTGSCIALVSHYKYRDFAKKQVRRRVKNMPISYKVPGSQVIGDNEDLFYIEALCASDDSGSGAGSRLLKYIEQCGVIGYEYSPAQIVALKAIPSAYSFYCKNGYLHTKDLQTLYPLYNVDKRITFTYDRDMCYNTKQYEEDAKNMFPKITAFKGETINNGMLLMKRIIESGVRR